MKSQKLVTVDQLAAIVRARPGSGPMQRIMEIAPALNKTMLRYEIDNRLRIAHFIAQIAHESMGFQRMEEIWPNPNLDAKGVARNGNRWQLRYENMLRALGNTHPGDGYRFRGRGLIQLTGRANYRAYGRAVGQDLTTGRNMDAVARLPLAVDVAGWFWTTRRVNLNRLADADDFIGITRAINGGENGREHRRRLLVRAKQILEINGNLKPRNRAYTVRTGDSLARIAHIHGVSLHALKAANPDVKGPGFTIYPGQQIRIPGGEQ